MPATLLTEAARKSEAVVQVCALSAGHFSLPEHQFVRPASETGRISVPALAFLVQHVDENTGKKTCLLFDLGLRRDTSQYSTPIQNHITNRQPLTTDPDVVKSLALAGLTPNDIDYVIFSHVHWDHVGQPLDFPQSRFVVGNGSIDLLHGKTGALRGGHSFFEADLLPEARTTELYDPKARNTHSDSISTRNNGKEADFDQDWVPLGDLPAVLDVFHDGSVYLVDAPGHLAGHLNLLARIGFDKWVYLAGDACHDRRILRGELEIGEWHDAQGHLCCIHADRPAAEETIRQIRMIEEQGIEVIIAHDAEWERNPNKGIKLWGA